MLALVLVVVSVAGCSSGSTSKEDAVTKVGFIYVGPADDGGWSQAHDNGRAKMVENMGGKVETIVKENVPEEKSAVQKKQNVFSMLFSPTYIKGTLLLWFTYFMGLVVIYLLTSWLPTLMRETGATMERAAFIGGLFQFGGVLSALFIGWAMDRFNPNRIIAGFYFVAGIFAFAVGQSLSSPTLLAILVLCAGVAINGAQSSMPALSARFYPTQCRATGVAWMSGIGRFGAVFGAWIGAVLLGNDWSFTAILSLLLIPAVAAAVAIFVKSLVAHTDAA